MSNLAPVTDIQIVALHYDIIQQICTEIPLKKDLLSFSLTCKSLLDPMMEKIWAELSSFGPLFMTMPEDLFSVTTSEIVPPQDEDEQDANTATRTIDSLSMIRPVSGLDWGRFSWYARRVKAITQQPFLHPKTRKRLHIDSSIWEGYAKHTSQNYFPLLRSITFDWHGDKLGPAILPCLGIILRAEITEVRFLSPFFLSTILDDDIPSLLRTIADLCPRIESFDCNMFGFQSTGYSTSQLVETLYSLRDLKTNSALSHGTFLHLANLSSLRSLSLFLTNERIDDIPTSFPAATFPHLQSLSIRAMKWNLIERMLPLILTQLTTLRLHAPFSSGIDVDLSRVVSLQTRLVHLALEFGNPFQGNMQQDNLAIDILAPLKDLAHLESFKLKCKRVPGFVTPFLTTKPCPLPHLRQLTLINKEDYRSAPFRLAEMTSLLEDYPLLQELNAPIMLDPFPLEGVVPAKNVVSVLSASGLKYPRRYQSQCDAVFYSAVIHCLKLCFPLLETIGGKKFGTTHEERVVTLERLNSRGNL